MIVTPERAIADTTAYVEELKRDVGPDAFARMVVGYTATTYWQVSRHAMTAGLIVGAVVGLCFGMALMLIVVAT